MTKLPPHALEALTYPSANVSGWIANLIFSTSPPGPTRKSCFVFAVFLATLIPRSRFQRAHSVCTWSSRERFAPRRWPGNGGNWNFYCCSDWKSHWAIQAPARQKIPSVIVVTGSNWLCKTGKIMVAMRYKCFRFIWTDGHFAAIPVFWAPHWEHTWEWICTSWEFRGIRKCRLPFPVDLFSASALRAKTMSKLLPASTEQLVGQ